MKMQSLFCVLYSACLFILAITPSPASHATDWQLHQPLESSRCAYGPLDAARPACPMATWSALIPGLEKSARGLGAQERDPVFGKRPAHTGGGAH
jgi:hypothetical protein